VKFTIKGAQLSELSKDATTQLKTSIRDSIAAEAGVDKEKVEVSLQAGSIVVTATIKTQDIDDVMLKVASPAAQEKVTKSVVENPDLQAAGLDLKVSPMEISSTTEPEYGSSRVVEAPAPPATTPAPMPAPTPPAPSPAPAPTPSESDERSKMTSAASNVQVMFLTNPILYLLGMALWFWSF
jgi:hypothetical protein